MAGDGECFTVGSVVSCTTCYDQEFEGEVIAFDQFSKILVIKSPSAKGRSVCDVHLIYLDKTKNVEVKKEATGEMPALQNLNIQRLSNRAKNKIEEKQRQISALSAGVSTDGQTLFLAITKTISDVTWSDKSIIVMNQVSISPPYRPDNVKALVEGKTENKALTHIKKIVEKHMKDQAEAQVDRLRSE